MALSDVSKDGRAASDAARREPKALKRRKSIGLKMAKRQKKAIVEAVILVLKRVGDAKGADQHIGRQLNCGKDGKSTKIDFH